MRKSSTLSFFCGIIIVIIFISLTGITMPTMKHKDMAHQREDFIALKNNIISSQLPHTNYRCCLEKPCTYCIEKTPGHGEGATCDCLRDVVNGKHPCGECIGEILEGHGNPYLAEYFATAIADEVGEQHRAVLQQIIEEKYNFPIEDQF